MKFTASGRNRPRRRARALLLVVAFAVALQPGIASAENTAAESGIGAASALCSLVYGPVKLTYATLGLVFGGFGWALSGGDRDVMEAVIMPAVRGDYVVTPSHLRGERPLEFIGRRPGYESTPPPSGGFDDSY